MKQEIKLELTFWVESPPDGPTPEDWTRMRETCGDIVRVLNGDDGTVTLLSPVGEEASHETGS